ncbi:MAG: efflux RND transporter periplasmic adaptor subunit [Planctomycetota bacterium]
MRFFIPLLLLLATAAPVAVTGAESPSTPAKAPSLELATAQPLHETEITISARVVPLLSTRVGSRLTSFITTWAKTEAGDPLDVGMPVKTGQELFQVDPATFQSHLDQARAARETAVANLDNMKAKPRPERMIQLQSTLMELDARLAETARDEERFKRLVEKDKTLPPKRLEEIRTGLEILKAQRQAAQARLDEAVNGPTATELAVAEAQVRQAEAIVKAAENDMRDTTVRAPFDGIITRRFKGLGDFVAGMPFVEVMEITTPDRLEADLALPGKYLGRITAGATGVVLRSPLLSEDLKLPVTRVVADVDAVLGTFTARIRIPPDKRGNLAAGTLLSATMKLPETTDVVIPLRAIHTEGDAAWVWVAREGACERRAVVIGDRLSAGMIVKKGIAAGESVVTGTPPKPAGNIQENRAE